MKNKMVRCLALGMSAVMMFSIAACQSEENNEAQSAGAVSEAVQEEEAEVKEEAEGDTSSELTTVRVLCKNQSSAEIFVEDYEKYPVSQVIIKDLEEIGIRLELECIDNDSFKNVVNTRMASGVDVPDLISYCWVGSTDQQDVLSWGQNGLLYTVNELTEKYDEDGSIKAFYDEKAPGIWEQHTAEDGNIYWFTYLVSGKQKVDKETGLEYTQACPKTLSIRKDWVEAVGEEVKTVYTPDELLALLKKIQEQDANGNGKADEVVYLPIDSFANGIATGFGLTRQTLAGYMEDDNVVFNNFYHENFPAYIEFMNSLYENGLYDTVALGTEQIEMLATNRCALVYNYSNWDYETSLPEDVKEGAFYQPILLDLDGDPSNGFPVHTDNADASSYCQFFVPKACENPEGVAKLMDYIYTDRYAVLNQMGIEGKGHEIDENGNYVLLSGGEESIAFWFTGAGLYALPRMIVIADTVERTDSNAAEYIQQKQLWDYSFYTELYPMADKVEFGSQALAMPTASETTVIEESTNVLTTYIQETLSELILGKLSIDNLADYQKEMDGLGMQELIAAQQARRSRVVGN